MHKTQIESLAKGIMYEHGLTTEGWTFGWSRAVRQAGVCYTAEKRILISAKVVAEWSDAAIKDLVLHEVAHALTPKDKGHGREWKQVATAIGCNAKRLYDGRDPETKVSIKPKWLGVCDACGWRRPTHRRATASCGKCNPRTYDERYRIVYVPNV